MGSMDQSSINSVVFSDFELVIKVLENSKSLTAREISSAVTKFGIKWDKGQSNSALYKMLAKGLVEKDTSQGTRPYWRLSRENTKSLSEPLEKIKVLNKNPSRDEFIPLRAISEYTIILGENLVGVLAWGAAARNAILDVFSSIKERKSITNENITAPYELEKFKLIATVHPSNLATKWKNKYFENNKLGDKWDPIIMAEAIINAFDVK